MTLLAILVAVLLGFGVLLRRMSRLERQRQGLRDRLAAVSRQSRALRNGLSKFSEISKLGDAQVHNGLRKYWLRKDLPEPSNEQTDDRRK